VGRGGGGGGGGGGEVAPLLLFLMGSNWGKSNYKHGTEKSLSVSEILKNAWKKTG
jgi:hypothetical protein